MLASAIRLGQWTDAEALLAVSAPIDGRLPGSGDTVLHIAVEARNPGFLRRLIEAGAPIDAVNAAGDTPLMTACRADFPVEARLLLASGADPNACNGGWTPLRYAARDRNTPAIGILRAGGAATRTTSPVDGWAAALDAFVAEVGKLE